MGLTILKDSNIVNMEVVPSSINQATDSLPKASMAISHHITHRATVIKDLLRTSTTNHRTIKADLEDIMKISMDNNREVALASTRLHQIWAHTLVSIMAHHPLMEPDSINMMDTVSKVHPRVADIQEATVRVHQEVVDTASSSVGSELSKSITLENH